MALDGIAFSKDGRSYVLTAEGAVHIDGAASAAGEWTTQARTEDAKNKIAIQVDGEEPMLIPCTFSFTEEANQLEVGIAEGFPGVEGARSHVFNGQIAFGNPHLVRVCRPIR